MHWCPASQKQLYIISFFEPATTMLQAECLWNSECTLGSAITNSGSDSTDSAAKQGPRKGAVLLAVDGNVTESYYCRTAPAWNDPNIQERGMIRS